MKKIISVVLMVGLCLLLVAPTSVHAESVVSIKPVTVSSAGDRTAAITADGTLWMWGNYAQPFIDERGGFDTGYKKSPVKILTDAVYVCCSTYHAAAIKKDGSLWMWGSNDYGQLGNGKKDDVIFGGESYQLSPVKVMDDVAMVSCGFAHTAAIKTDGSLWLFGSNEYGQIGNNCAGDVAKAGLHSVKPEYALQTVPTKVMDDVAYVSCGYNFTAAIKKDGTLWTWGDNQRGQLGNGEYGGSIYRGDQYVPVKILDNVMSVSCGNSHVAAVDKDGVLWTWGWNGHGCLGVGSTSVAEKDGYNSSVPVRIMDGVLYVDCGKYSTAVVKDDGTLWIWGANMGVEIIGGDLPNSVGTPTKVMDDCRGLTLDDAIAIFVIKSDGALYGWGRKAYLGIGKDSNEIQSTPVKVLDNIAMPDAPSDWAEKEVKAAIKAKLVPKALQQCYQQPISRANMSELFIKLIEKTSGKKISKILSKKGLKLDKSTFTDTSNKSILAMNVLGIITGKKDKFDPDGTFTEAQAVTAVKRTAKVLGIKYKSFGVKKSKTKLTTEQAIVTIYRAFKMLKRKS